jgi:hypothetical protein
MGQIVAELGASLGVLLSDLGLRLGIWQAMAGSGSVSVEEIAAATGVPFPIVREWGRSQAAAGYLHYDPEADRYELPEAVAALCSLRGPVAPPSGPAWRCFSR